MANLELTYFDFPGGRAEPARLAMHIGDIAFDDVRFPFEKFAEVRKTPPLNQVPTLKINGAQITQSNAITRYVGKLAGLYPSDEYQALLCDEIMDALEDVSNKLVATFGLPDEAMKEARDTLVSGPLTQYLGWAQTRLQNAGGEYFANNALSIADLKVFVWVRSLNAGFLDHIPTTLVEDVAPLLNAHFQRIGQTPSIAAYYAAMG